MTRPPGDWPETYIAYQDSRKRVREAEYYEAYSRLVRRVVLTVGISLCAFSVLMYWWVLP